MNILFWDLFLLVVLNFDAAQSSLLPWYAKRLSWGLSKRWLQILVQGHVPFDSIEWQGSECVNLKRIWLYTVISLFDENGEILEVLEDRKEVVMKLVSEVKEVEEKMWIGTVAYNHIATLPYP